MSRWAPRIQGLHVLISASTELLRVVPFARPSDTGKADTSADTGANTRPAGPPAGRGRHHLRAGLTAAAYVALGALCATGLVAALVAIAVLG